MNRTIEQNYHISVPIEKVWQALADQNIVEKWTGAKAKISAEPGGQFEFWDHSIFGTFTQLVKPTLITQLWQQEGWDKPSNVTINLSENGKITDISLIHTDFPESEKDELEEGWDKYYFGAIKELLERS